MSDYPPSLLPLIGVTPGLQAQSQNSPEWLGRPKLICIGDSILALGNLQSTPTAINCNGAGLITVNSTAHGMWKGARIRISGCTPDYFNGYFTVTDRLDADNFTCTLTGTNGSIVTASGSVIRWATLDKNNDVCIPNLANALLHQRMHWLCNYAVGGDTSAQTLAWIDKWAGRGTPDICLVHSGVNDVINDVPYATTTANYVAIWNRLISLGIRPVVMTCSPLGSAYVSYTTARGVALHNLNRFIKDYAAQNKTITVVDSCAAVIDSTSTTGNWIATPANSTDFIHPNNLGAFKIARAVADVLSGIIPPSTPLPIAFNDNYGTDSTSFELNDNALMQGTGGTVTAPASGTAPTGYTVSRSGTATVVASIVERADGNGNNVRIAMTPAASLDLGQIVRSSLSSRVSAGKTYVMSANVQGASINASLRYLEFRLSITMDGYSFTINGNSDGGTDGWSSDFDMVLETAPFTIPTGSTVTSFQPSIQFVGNGAGGTMTLDIGEWTVHEVQSVPAS